MALQCNYKHLAERIAMPFFGLGLHLLVALFFAVHVVKTGKQLYWLLILFSFPLLGSIVYFFAIFLPDSKLERSAMKAVSSVARSLDPGKELREAKEAFDFTPTAQNQMRYASALLESGAAHEAAKNYEACLQGPFADDLDIKFNASRAFIDSNRFPEAITHLTAIRSKDPKYRFDQVSLLMARALSLQNRKDEAKAEFEAAVEQSSSFELRAEYAIWAAEFGDLHTVQRLKPEIEQMTKRWGKHTHELNRELTRRLETAFSKL
jgi:hypothetical protein